MRILSQDGIGTIDLPYEQVGFLIHSKTEIIAFPIVSLSSDEYWVMTRYSTEEKAKMVIEMLKQCLCVAHNVQNYDGTTKSIIYCRNF